MPSNLGQTLRGILEAHADENVRAFQLAPIFESNPVYTYQLLAQPMLARKVAEWTEEDPKRIDKELVFARRSLSLLGKSATRNFAASIRLVRAGEAGTPRKKTDRLTVQPAQLIPCALAAENLCLEKSWVHSEIAYWAGLHYDWIAGLATARKAPKEVKTVLQDAFKEGLRIAQLAYEMAGQLKSVKHSKFVFSAGLLVPLGKALLSAGFPGSGNPSTWAGHVAACEKLGAQRAFAEEFLEKKRFGMSHVELSALYVSAMGLYAEIEPAIRYAREPWVLEGKPELEPLAQLAMILSVATTLAGGASLSKHEQAWLASNHIDAKALHVPGGKAK